MEIALPQRTSGPSTAVSLYQQTLSMIEKLYSLPGFDHYLFPNGVDAYVADPTSFAPFEIIWACFRLGTPFLHLYNQLRPKKRLSVPVLGEAGAPPKKAVYEFLVACKSELHLQEKELFTISGLFKDDTNEFVKLMNTISIVVQKIEDMGLFPLPKPLPFALPSVRSTGGPQDNRAKLLTEMLNTERAYAADLEKLQRYQRELQSQDVVPRDMLLQLFANLDELLDFQRRFLLQMEATLSMPPAEQHIGQLYITNEEAFTVYVPFCGNYHSAIQIATENAATLQRVPDMDPVRELPSYLIKPVQRVCKYPLLLNELVKYSDPATYPHMEELKEGLAAIKRVTDLVNEEQRQEENRRIKQDVLDRVEDWKDLDVNEFGSLLLSDRFPMNSGDAEKDFDLFLFETILLCCKDTAKKRKSKKNIDTTSYQLKGNIYIDRIDSIMDECSAEEQRFQLKVFWKDGLETESFVLRCRNMEQVKLWKGRLDGLLSAQRMQRLSMKEATANMYSRSMQVNPEFIRRMSVAPNSYDDGRGLYSAQQQQQQQQFDSPLSPTTEFPPIQRSKSIPYNYYQPNLGSTPSSEMAPTSTAYMRQSAPANPRSSTRSGTTTVSTGTSSSSRGRSTSPPPMIRKDSKTYEFSGDPLLGDFMKSKPKKGRERSKSRPREEPKFSKAPPPMPLPEPPVGFASNGYVHRGGPPAQPLPTVPSNTTNIRRPSKASGSEPAGYFDGYDAIPIPLSSSARGRGGDFRDPSDLPPSPPQSMPGSPRGSASTARKMSLASAMAPPRSMTSPFPLSQVYQEPQRMGSTSSATSVYDNAPPPSGSNSSQQRAGSVSNGYEQYTRPIQQTPALMRVTVTENQIYRANSSPDGLRPYTTISNPSNTNGNTTPYSMPPDGIRPPRVIQLAQNPPDMPLPPTPQTYGSGSTTTQTYSLQPPRKSSFSASFAGGQNGVVVQPGPQYQPQQQPPPPPQHYNSSSSLNSLNSITPGSPTATLRIRMHHGASNQSFVIAVAPTVTFSDLQAKMERKIRLCGGNQDGRRLRMRYKDEDGDFIAIANDEDVGMCFEAARGRMGKSGGEGFVNVWIV